MTNYYDTNSIYLSLVHSRSIRNKREIRIRTKIMSSEENKTRCVPPSPFRVIQNIRKRRSRSAPAKLRKNLMIENHFRVENNEGDGKRLVLPGAIKYEESWQRDSHDFFNLIVLLPIIVLVRVCFAWALFTCLKPIYIVCAVY